MYHAHFMGAPGHWFWIVPVLFMILMMVCVVRRIRRARRWRAATGGRTGWGLLGCCDPGRQTAGQILARRYARGEITKEQYQQIKGDLDSDCRRPQPESE
jgi:putative membrane protein